MSVSSFRACAREQVVDFADLAKHEAARACVEEGGNQGQNKAGHERRQNLYRCVWRTLTVRFWQPNAAVADRP